MILEASNLPADLNGYTINLIMIDLDTMVGEAIFLNADDSYTILINSRISSEMQRACFLHALDHIRNNDWSKQSVQEIESAAHGRGF